MAARGKKMQDQAKTALVGVNGSGRRVDGALDVEGWVGGARLLPCPERVDRRPEGEVRKMDGSWWRCTHRIVGAGGYSGCSVTMTQQGHGGAPAGDAPPQPTDAG